MDSVNESEKKKKKKEKETEEFLHMPPNLVVTLV
jgi:hypothetical protein